MEMLKRIQDHVNENRGGRPPITDLDEPLQLDSLSFIRTVAFIENELGVRVEDDEYIADNFETFRAIGRFVDAKTGRSPG